MKHLIQLMAVGITILLTSCGEFYTFEESEPADNVSITVMQDTVYLMVGDTMALQVRFSPERRDPMPVFWYPAAGVDSCAKVLNDTLMALRTGEVDMVAVGGSGTLADTCHVVVVDRWLEQDFSHEQPSDMVIYANITVGGKPWNPEEQQVAAVVRGRIAGFAEQREAHGVRYALLRLWSVDDEDVGTVTLYCYDRQRRWLYAADRRPDFSGLAALGTLSSLYPINF